MIKIKQDVEITLQDFDHETTTSGQKLCLLYRECQLYGVSV